MLSTAGSQRTEILGRYSAGMKLFTLEKKSHYDLPSRVEQHSPSYDG
jgi:hypothetical protein